MYGNFILRKDLETHETWGSHSDVTGDTSLLGWLDMWKECSNFIIRVKQFKQTVLGFIDPQSEDKTIL
jgi:hypothetical protein